LSAVGTGLGAAEGRGPKTEAVSATFTNSPVPGTVHSRQCTGSDGAQYLEEKGTYVGPEVSVDQRLSGTLENHIDLLINLSNGVGSATGTFTLRDADTGTLKQSGQFAEATAGTALKGFIVGHLAGGGTLFANLSALVDGTGVVRGELGLNAGVSTDLATIRTGSCGESSE
jgi:hypothetical protein